MSLSRILDHQRAEHASRAVKPVASGSKEKFKKYRTVVLNAGTAIRQLGLLQFVAFALSKAKKEEHDAHQVIVKDLFDWLAHSDATKRTAPRWQRESHNSTPRIQLMEDLVQKTSAEIALLEAESQQYLVWLKRLTEAAWKERETNDNPAPTGRAEVGP